MIPQARTFESRLLLRKTKRKQTAFGFYPDALDKTNTDGVLYRL